MERADSEEDAGGECGLLIEAVYPVLGSPESVPSTFGDVIARPEGFESSATAKDCGGGSTEVVFDDGERDESPASSFPWGKVYSLFSLLSPDHFTGVRLRPSFHVVIRSHET